MKKWKGCEKEMRQLNVQKSSQLSRKFQEQDFIELLRRLQWFLFEKNWINIIEDRDSLLHFWSRHFLKILTCLLHINPFAKNSDSNLTSLNF